MFLFLWLASQSLQLIFGVLAVRQQPDVIAERKLGSRVLAGLASIPPIITLWLFVRVFVVGGSSHVAQLAGESGFDLWSSWGDWWPVLFFGNSLAFLFAVAIAFIGPYPPQRRFSVASRTCAVIVAGIAWYTVVTRIPDA